MTAEPVVTVRLMAAKVLSLTVNLLIFQKCMAELPDETHYLYVGVGDRTFWKDQSCIFRTSPKTQLKR